MISEYEIVTVAQRLARAVHAPTFEDLAVYLLITVGHFQMTDVAKRFDFRDRSDCLAALNRVSVAYLTRDPRCVREVVDKARLTLMVQA